MYFVHVQVQTHLVCLLTGKETVLEAYMYLPFLFLVILNCANNYKNNVYSNFIPWAVLVFKIYYKMSLHVLIDFGL